LRHDSHKIKIPPDVCHGGIIVLILSFLAEPRSRSSRAQSTDGWLAPPIARAKIKSRSGGLHRLHDQFLFRVGNIEKQNIFVKKYFG
jgi:hypothetical protein